MTGVDSDNDGLTDYEESLLRGLLVVTRTGLAPAYEKSRIAMMF